MHNRTIHVLLASCIPLGPFVAPATMLVLLVIAQLLLHPRWSEGSYKQQTSTNLLSELSPDLSRCHYRTLSTYKEITTRQVKIRYVGSASFMRFSTTCIHNLRINRLGLLVVVGSMLTRHCLVICSLHTKEQSNLIYKILYKQNLLSILYKQYI